jgi:calmodulin
MSKKDQNRGTGVVSENEEAEYRAAFGLFDKDGDGHISTSELLSVFKALGQDVDESDVRV